VKEIEEMGGTTDVATIEEGEEPTNGCQSCFN
jgi:hypothetical protein